MLIVSVRPNVSRCHTATRAMVHGRLMSARRYPDVTQRAGRLRDVTAAHDYEEMHQLINRLTPDQLGEVRAHALRLAAGRKRFVPWEQACATASSLPKVDYEQFRSDIDDAVVQDVLLGDDR